MKWPWSRNTPTKPKVRADVIGVGDEIPAVRLQQGAPEDFVDLADFANGVIIGVPAAFSPVCNMGHLPRYIRHPKSPSSNIVVIAVNDVFVMDAWKKQLDPQNSSRIRFLSDVNGEFTKKVGLGFDGRVASMGGLRSKRYAMVVADHKVVQLGIEPDPTKITVSAADRILA